MTIVERTYTWSSKGKPGIRKVTAGLVVHHSGEAAAAWDAARIHAFHRDIRGWVGIGYHFVVLPNGVVERGRPEDWVGAHCPGVNTTHLGVCLPGEFSQPRYPTTAQLQSTADLWRFLSDRYGWDRRPETLSGHRDHYRTACPGQNLYMLLPDIRRMAAGSVVEWPCDGQGVELGYQLIDDVAYVGVRDLAEALGYDTDTTGWPRIRVVKP